MTCDYCDDLEARTELVLDMPVQACDHCKGLAFVGIFPKSEEHRQRRPFDCAFCLKWTAQAPHKFEIDGVDYSWPSYCGRRACIEKLDEYDVARERMRSVGLR